MSSEFFPIQKITISNFKGIKTAQLRELKRINLLIGANSAGKSTLLESLLVFRLIRSGKLTDLLERRSARNNWRSQDLFWNYQTGNSAFIEIANVRNNRLGVRLELATGGSVSTKWVLDGAEKGTNASFSANLGLVGMGTTLEEVYGKDLALQLQSVQFFDNQMKRDLAPAESSFLSAIKDEGADAGVRESFNKVYHEHTSWEFLSYGGQFRVSLKDKLGRARWMDEVGEGSRAGFLLLSLAISMTNTCLLIEEIENHQHPSALQELISQLDQISKLNNLQVFISTHSPDVFRYCAQLLDVSLQYIQRSDDGIMNSTSLSGGDMTPLINLGWDIGNILKAEKFVLVEGIDDVEFLKHSFFKVKQHWPEEFGITLIPVGGTLKFTTVIRPLMFPGRKLFVIRDLDTSTKEVIVQSVISTIGDQFAAEGYEVERPAEGLRIKKDSRLVLELPASRILTAGNLEDLPGIKKHEFEDYLILILCNVKGTESKSLSGESSKSVLRKMINSDDIDKETEILSNCSSEHLPKTLIEVINALF